MDAPQPEPPRDPQQKEDTQRRRDTKRENRKREKEREREHRQDQQKQERTHSAEREQTGGKLKRKQKHANFCSVWVVVCLAFVMLCVVNSGLSLLWRLCSF